jgi:Tetratricopeptide repeat/Carbohydrate binding domain
MILCLSDSLSRGLVVAAALLVGLWLTFFGVRAAIARHDSEGDTAMQLESAVRLEPGNPAYWYALGRFQQYNLEQPDALMAEQSYRKAIALNPYATEAWLDLGTAHELDGRTEEAREAYRQAKKTYPNSADVAWRYGNFLLRQGEQTPAYAEMRLAIDADPQRAAAAFSRAYRSNPNIDELLDQLLPAKQDVYVEVIWEALSARQLAVAKTVWSRLFKLHDVHLTMRDVDHFVSELLATSDFTEARQAWDQGTATMKFPPLYQLQGSVVWDPSFESDSNGTSFAWHYLPVTQGVTVALDKTEKPSSGKQSLRLTFDGRHDPNVEASCTLAIVQPNTTYQFSGWVKTNALTSDQGIGFRLHAFGDANVPTVNTSKVLGTTPWSLVEQTWTSGPKVHRLQICVVRDASENPEARISGAAWVDDVNLLPQPTEHRKP